MYILAILLLKNRLFKTIFSATYYAVYKIVIIPVTNHNAKIVAEFKFVSTTREDHNAEIVAEVKFVSTTK